MKHVLQFVRLAFMASWSSCTGEFRQIPRIRTDRVIHKRTIRSKHDPLHPALPVAVSIVGAVSRMENSHGLRTDVHEVPVPRPERSL